MKGYQINPDAAHVAKIMEGLAKKNGHCPCRVNRDDTALCPCDEFIGEGVCRCKLFMAVSPVREYID